LYWVALESSPLQASLGQLLTGTKMMTTGGRRVALGRVGWRFAVPLLVLAGAAGAVLGFSRPEIALGLGVLWVLGYLLGAVTPRKQALHDLLAATVVIHRGSSAAVASTGAPVVVPVVISGRRGPGCLSLGCFGLLALLVVIGALGASVY